MLSFAKRSISRADVVQFAKYFAAGSSYFWSAYIIFAIGYSGFHWSWWTAKMAGDVVGWTLNYLLQRYWAFANKSLAKREGVALLKYAAVTAFNLALDYAIVGGLKALGVSPYFGAFLSAGFFTVWNYAWYRFWVFFSEKGGESERQRQKRAAN